MIVFAVKVRYLEIISSGPILNQQTLTYTFYFILKQVGKNLDVYKSIDSKNKLKRNEMSYESIHRATRYPNVNIK